MREACKHKGSAVQGTKTVHTQGRVRAGKAEFCLGGQGWLPGTGDPGESSRTGGKVAYGRRMFWADEIAGCC